MSHRADNDIEHAEFVQRTQTDGILWGVRGFYHPVLIVWGFGALLAALAVTLAVLTPAFGFAFYCVWSAQYGGLLWMLPITFAFLIGGPGLNGLDLFKWILCALVGLACAAFFGPVHLAGGLVPGLTWLLAGAHKGVIMVAMEDRLRDSAEAYERIRQAGLLFVSKTR